jgi:hypothetical protein
MASEQGDDARAALVQALTQDDETAAALVDLVAARLRIEDLGGQARLQADDARAIVTLALPLA